MTVRLTLFLSSLVTLSIVHNVALKFYLYWTYLWLDIPIHVLGGVCVALGISVLPLFRVSVPMWIERMAGTLFVVLIVGILWEIFEFTSGISEFDDTFVFDTTLDLFMDMLGGIIGYGLVRSTQNI